MRTPARLSGSGQIWVLMPCRALEAFRRFRAFRRLGSVVVLRLNALSGIGGVQTTSPPLGLRRLYSVLMPCRALEAFRHSQPGSGRKHGRNVLMPCRALEAFRLKYYLRRECPFGDCVLMPCRALEAFRRPGASAERT